MESTSISVKYDKFWRFGFESISTKIFGAKDLLPRQLGSSLKFQAKAPKTAEAVPAEAADVEDVQANKEKPAAAEAVGSATEIEEVGKVARLVRGLKDDFGAFWK